MRPAELAVVCLAVGDAYGDEYIERLQVMLQRHCPVPFTLHCYSDRPRTVPQAVNLVLPEDWRRYERPGMRQTTKKLRLFGKALLPSPEFLYLDLTLVIRQDMGSLLDFAFGAPQDLVIIDDWHNPGYNSSVMRIRTGALSIVEEAFLAGEQYPQQVPGDQDFLHACLQAKGLADRVALFPEGQIISFKRAAKLNRNEPAKAEAMLKQATIVKFHGDPKPHEVLGSLWDNLRMRLRRSGRFGLRDMQPHWRLEANEPSWLERRRDLPAGGGIRPIGQAEYRLRSLRYRLLNSVLRLRHIVSTSRFYGLRFRAIAGDRHACLIAQAGATEAPITMALLGLVPGLPGSVMLDIGANLGWYSCVFSRAMPELRIHAFEPDPVMHGLLRDNLALNELTGIVPVQAAVSNRQGSATLYQDSTPNRGESSLLPVGEQASDVIVTAPTLVLDSYLAEAGLDDEPIRFIRLDVEGQGYEALRGAPQALRRCHCLLMEYSPQSLTRSGDDGQGLLQLLVDAGLKPNVIDQFGIRPTSVDKLLSASRQVNMVWTR
ncbi:hypothetical protein C3942_12780 [Solimonas fluminis]|uniref:Methyltransferase FkbM domain-containing protein n=1 Tax=Solimonas fluminis TaxID=2086571 RepID=A0A2S5TF97_9GAMM|nr:FkbM family methyltransferase [Solimonas fluminis]PPE73663.1 hypothetical protein C3942_12780 [Solimonas fluminis]